MRIRDVIKSSPGIVKCMKYNFLELKNFQNLNFYRKIFFLLIFQLIKKIIFRAFFV